MMFYPENLIITRSSVNSSVNVQLTQFQFVQFKFHSIKCSVEKFDSKWVQLTESIFASCDFDCDFAHFFTFSAN